MNNLDACLHSCLLPCVILKSLILFDNVWFYCLFHYIAVTVYSKICYLLLCIVIFLQKEFFVRLFTQSFVGKTSAEDGSFVFESIKLFICSLHESLSFKAWLSGSLFSALLAFVKLSLSTLSFLSNHFWHH